MSSTSCWPRKRPSQSILYGLLACQAEYLAFFKDLLSTEAFLIIGVSVLSHVLLFRKDSSSKNFFATRKSHSVMSSGASN